MKIEDVRPLYPKSVLLSIVVKSLAATTRCLVHTKKQENMSEFRYVMD